MNLNDLDPDSPEYEAAIEAAQAEEDAASGNTEGETREDEHTDPEGDPERDPADGTAADPEAQPTEVGAPGEAKPETEAKTPQAKVAGVLSKDGQHILPYSAIQAERQRVQRETSARERAEARAADLERQIEDLKAGRKPEPAASTETDELSAEELADLTDSIPAVGKLAKQLQATRAELAKLKPEPAKSGPDPEPQQEPGDEVQEAIDAVPLLLNWQLTDAEKFERAKEYDALLMRSPKWAKKPLDERFAEAARRVADEFDIQVEEDTPPPTPNKPTPNKADPKTVISTAKRTTPSTLSDFKGGATDTDLGRIENLPVHKMRARFADMSDDEIDRQLAKSGG